MTGQNAIPGLVESALKNRQQHFVIDGEAVILGVDGRSDFDALHSGRHNEEVQLYAFDMLAGVKIKATKARLCLIMMQHPLDGRLAR